MEKFPPPNYIAVETKLPGFEIYAPAPEKKDDQPIHEFKCPQCGAVTSFSIKQAALSCQHCGYQEALQAKVVGTQAEAMEFSLANLAIAAHGWGEERKDLRCLSCGAEIAIPADSIAASCAFCGSNKVIQEVANQERLRPKFLIPFKIDHQQCHSIAREWLGKSWMVPKELKKFASLDAFTAIYLPYWTFHANTSATWKAEVGHQRTERYYDSGSKSWKTRTKIVWRWESGQVTLNINDLLIAGTERVSAHHLKNVDQFNLADMVAYTPAFLAGLQAKGYDRPLETAWELAREVMREQTKRACIGQASTSLVRNFSMKMDFSDESWRYLLLPVYLAAYQFENKTFHAIVNGQTGKISGQRPVDWKKIWLVIALIFSPGLLMSIFGFVWASSAGEGYLLGFAGLFFLFVALIAAIIILVGASKEGKA